MAGKEPQKKLGELLVDKRLISKAELEEALREQSLTGHFLGEVLVSRGTVSGEQVAQTLSEQLGFAYVDLANMTIDPKAIEIVPQEMCLKYEAVPIFVVHNTLTLAMTNALDISAIDEFQAACKLRVRPVFASFAAIREAIDKHYNAPQDVSGLENLSPVYTSREVAKEPDKGSDQLDSLRQAASLAPVIEMVNNIIAKAVDMHASDIHIEPSRNDLGCRYRIDGVLYPVSRMSIKYQAAVVSRIKIMADLDIAEKRLPQDGRIRTTVGKKDIDLRISTFPTLHGENLVVRILDHSGGLLKLQEIGFVKDVFGTFSELIRRPYGIILVTGPTGSGKTTTLYAALNEINSKEKNVITLEDPVEYEIEDVRQSQVNVKAGLTFATGLRSIVRQDPDIIMIGEIRDKETADIAIHAALTGHLVFSTLHTNDAPSAITRLVDMGVEPFLLSSSVIGIIAQRLVRVLCDSCKSEYEPNQDLLKQQEIKVTPEKRLKFYKEEGCNKCKKWGYSGRSGIFELLVPNDSIKDLITQKAPVTMLREAARANGMKTLREAGVAKVLSGITSVSEVLRVTGDV